MNLQPLEDRIVVRPGEAEETTVSGLVIPDTAKEKPQQGEVLAVGPGRRSEQTGELIPVDVAVGDVVLYSKYGGTEVTRRRRGPARPLEPRRPRQDRRREEEVATNHDSGARGGRQRIPRPARPGPARGALGRLPADHAGRARADRPSSAAPVRRLHPAARASAPAGGRASRGARARCSSEDGEARARAHEAARDDAVAPGRDRVPGRQGRADRRRTTPRDAALREAEEEIGLAPRARRGGRRARPTMRHGRRASSLITPFVGLIDGRPIVVADPREVDRVFDVALVGAARPRGVPRGALGSWGFDGTERAMQFFELADETIWGATARILDRVPRPDRRRRA